MPGGALETEQGLSGPSSMFVGQKLDEHRGSFILEYPMDKGHVVDGGWDAMEALWEVREYVSYKSLVVAYKAFRCTTTSQEIFYCYPLLRSICIRNQILMLRLKTIQYF
jgi:hypothetical protein